MTNEGRKNDRLYHYRNNALRILQGRVAVSHKISLFKIMVVGDRFTAISNTVWQTFQVLAVEKGMKGNRNTYVVAQVVGGQYECFKV